MLNAMYATKEQCGVHRCYISYNNDQQVALVNFTEEQLLL